MCIRHPFCLRQFAQACLAGGGESDAGNQARLSVAKPSAVSLLLLGHTLNSQMHAVRSHISVCLLCRLLFCCCCYCSSTRCLLVMR